MSSEHFDRVEPYYNFPSTPFQPGYNCYSFAYDLSSIDSDIGIVFGEKLRAKLNLKLRDTNPFNIKTVEEDIALNEGSLDSIFDKMLEKTTNKSSKLPVNENINSNKSKDMQFKIHIRLLVMKKLCFEGFKGFIETSVSKSTNSDNEKLNSNLPSTQSPNHHPLKVN